MEIEDRRAKEAFSVGQLLCDCKSESYYVIVGWENEVNKSQFGVFNLESGRMYDGWYENITDLHRFNMNLVPIHSKFVIE